MKYLKIKQTKVLFVETEIKIRFSEVDSMAIVWHGNYVHYFEDGREAFGKKYELGYMDNYAKGYLTPIVKLNLYYKNPLIYGDEAIIKTTYIDSLAAKILFEYEIRRKSDNQIIATGESMQVFMNKNRELEITIPDFFTEWKKKYL